MTVLQGFLLGLLQGVTEFLPVSSSGHLAVVQYLFSLGEVPLLYDVMLHLASLVAVVLFFRRQIIELVMVLLRWAGKKAQPEDEPKQKMIVAIILATVVTGALGVVFSKIIPEMPLQVVCFGFIITGLLLILSTLLKVRQGEEGKVSVVQGLFCGFAQGLGVLPGISRSGITISACLAAGVNRKTAGEFSFLISIPAILGAFVLELKDFGELNQSVSAGAIAAGCVAAFAAGYAALFLLNRLIKNGKLAWFAAYLIPLGVCGAFLFK